MDESNRIVRYEWAVLAFLAIFFFCLGYWGWQQYFYLLHQARPWTDPLYLTLQLFALNSASTATEAPIPLPLEFARFAAPSIAIYAAAKGLAVLFHEHYMSFRLRFRKGHVVICGLGNTGYLYALDFARTSHHVVVIERDATNPNLSTVRAAGVHVIIGDAASDYVQTRAGMARASRIIAICGDDAINVQIANDACQAVEGQSRSCPLQCHVQIFNLPFLDLLDTTRFLQRTAKFNPAPFNFFRAEAAELLASYPLDRQRITVVDPHVVHLVIFGFGQMGESVALQAARIGHFANGKKIRVTVIDMAVDERIGSFNFRYPQFKNICDLETVKGRYQDVGLPVLEKACGEAQTLLTVAVCFDSDFSCLECGMHLKDAFKDHDFPIRVRLSQSSVLTKINCKDCQEDQRLTMFGALESACTVDRLLNASKIRVARQMHERYRAHRMASPGMTPEKIKDDPALRPWDELDEAFRQSSMQQMEHCSVKLRAVGCSGSLVPADSVQENSSLSGDFSFTAEEVEILSRMEHARWNAERWLAGWRLERHKKKDLIRKTSPCLLPWEELTDEIKEYDRVMVREIPFQLKVSRNDVAEGARKSC